MTVPNAEQLTVTTGQGPAQVALTAGPEPVGLLVLGPGASGKTTTKDLSAVRDAAVGDGWAVAVVTPPYAVAGRKVPPRGDGPDLAFAEVVASLRDRVDAGLPVVTGGRSFGSRVACRSAVATGAVAVLCLAFPLHPPGRPEKTRLAELEPVPVPVLVVQGARDPFGQPTPAPGRDVVVVAGDHSLARDLPGVVTAVRAFLARFAPAGRTGDLGSPAMGTADPATDASDDPLLTKVRDLCLALPGAKEKIAHGSPNWYTTKVFCWWGAHVKGDHDSDALARSISVLPDEDERQALLEDDRFHVPGYIGHRGWLAFDLTAGEPDWAEVAELIESSYRNTAGKRLIRELDAR